MPAIKILQVDRSACADDKCYEFFQKHLNKWLPLQSISFMPGGTVSYVTVHYLSIAHCLFPRQSDNVRYELQGIETRPLDVKLEFTTHCSECGKEHTVELTEQEYYNLWSNSLGKEYPALSDVFICVDCMNKDIEEDEVHRMVRESVEGMVQIDQDDYEKEFKHE